MAKFPPNQYQQDILDWINNGEGNALIEAKAGSGKTSTLVLAAPQICQYSNALFVAFNKHIVEELCAKPELENYVKKKSEGGLGRLKIYTANSLGDMAVKDYLRNNGYADNLNKCLQDNKLFPILKDIVVDMCRTRKVQITEEMVWDMIRELRTVCNKVRCKYITNSAEMAQVIIDQDKLCQFNLVEREDGLSYPYLPWAQIVEEAIDLSTQSFQNEGTYDFVDQLYLPVNLKLNFPFWLAPYTSFILVDEAQDMSAVQLALLKKVSNMPKRNGFKTRFVFVGDTHQAIYAFAGADCHSIENIQRQFKTTELPLNICYRCPKKVIELAKEYVPDIEAAPDAIEGEIHSIPNEKICDYVQPKDMVIARKNKDLAEVFLSIVLAGKPVYIKDKEMVDSTIKSIKKIGCKNVKALKEKIAKLHEEYKKQMRNPENQKQASAINNGTMDIYDMIISLLNFFIKEKKKSEESSVDSFIDFIKELFITEPSDNAVIVSSIHQVKGLEAKRVFIINYNQMPYTSDRASYDDNQQETNLLYIAITRAQEELFCCYGEQKEEDKSYYKKMSKDELEQYRTEYDGEYYDEIFE